MSGKLFIILAASLGITNALPTYRLRSGTDSNDFPRRQAAASGVSAGISASSNAGGATSAKISTVPSSTGQSSAGGPNVSGSASPSASGAAPSGSAAADGSKYVFMHHIVGNTENYTPDTWSKDIKAIEAMGVDAIALNTGNNPYEADQIKAAYDAAKDTKVKMFISFDFIAASDNCNADDLADRVKAVSDHPAQFKVGDKPLISSFDGKCLNDDGWQKLKDATGAYIMPFISGIEDQFASWKSLDSWLCWGCSFPESNTTTAGDGSSNDDHYINQLGLGNRFATTVGPWMFTHYPQDKFGGKNFIKSGEDFFPIKRWESLMKLRDSLTFVEMVAWNDWGESSYYTQVPDSSSIQKDLADAYWATGKDHEAWSKMSAYYVEGFKTGKTPPIDKDVVYYWARPHAAKAKASSDPVGPPTGIDSVTDSLFAAVFATGDGKATLGVGDKTKDFDVKQGVNQLTLPLDADAEGIKISVNIGGKDVVNGNDANYKFTTSPDKYDYNAWVGMFDADGGSSGNSTSSSGASGSSDVASSSKAGGTPAASSKAGPNPTGQSSAAGSKSSGAAASSASGIGPSAPITPGVPFAATSVPLTSAPGTAVSGTPVP